MCSTAAPRRAPLHPAAAHKSIFFDRPYSLPCLAPLTEIRQRRWVARKCTRGDQIDQSDQDPRSPRSIWSIWSRCSGLWSPICCRAQMNPGDVQQAASRMVLGLCVFGDRCGRIAGRWSRSRVQQRTSRPDFTFTGSEGSSHSQQYAPQYLENAGNDSAENLQASSGHKSYRGILRKHARTTSHIAVTRGNTGIARWAPSHACTRWRCVW